MTFVEKKVICPFCSEKVTFVLDKNKLRSAVTPIILSKIHGDPPHTLRIFLDKNLQIIKLDVTSQPVETHNYKVILIGDATVGKTSLILKFVEDRFANIYSPTMGVEISYQSVLLDNVPISLLLWDIAGQDRFKLVRNHYYKNAAGAVIVFDVTNEDSFNHILDWYNELKTYVPSASYILVGNKIDLVDQRKISQRRVSLLLRRLGCKYIETSAKTGENVKKMFKLIASEIYNSS
ncbi:MAG: GTP-binding protein [Candidatus Odinarchaeota archaeon]|nr:GTP-binding protein [Candidatus Odinarchaeota archaeon]